MYRYNPYTSVYRDPQSVKINELQRQRFQNAFNADDLIANAVSEMTVADFEGDQLLKERIQDETRQDLRDRAEKGDYETMMMDVSKSARKFQSAYAPLKKNYETYNAYVSKLKELHEKGFLDASDYKNTLRYSKDTYAGLQTDAEGNVIEDSFFGGYDPVKSVDLQEELFERVKGISPYGNVTTRKYSDPRGGTQVLPNGMEVPIFEVETENGWKTVEPERIEQIFQTMINEPDIAAAVDQKVMLNTYDIPDDRAILQIYGDRERVAQSLEDAKDKNDSISAAQLQRQLESLELMLTGTGRESEEDMKRIRNSYMQQNKKAQYLQDQLQTGIARFAYKQTTDKKKVGYDPLWLKFQKASEGPEGPEGPDPMSRKSRVYQKEALAGRSLEEADLVVEESMTAIDQSLARYKNATGVDVSVEQIMEGMVPPKGSEGLYAAMEKEVKGLLRTVAVIDNRKQKAAQRMGMEANPKMELEKRAAEKDYRIWRSGRPLDIDRFSDVVKEVTGKEDLTYAQTMEEVSRLRRSTIVGNLDSPERKQFDAIIENYNSQTDPSNNMTFADLNMLGKEHEKLKMDVKREWNKTVNDWMAKDESSILETAGRVVPVLDGYATKKQQEAATKEVLAVFKGPNASGIKDTDLIYYADENDFMTEGSAAQFKSDNNIKGKLDVKSVEFAVDATGTFDALEITLEAQQGVTTSKKEFTILYPIGIEGNASNEALERFSQRGIYQVGKIVNSVRAIDPKIDMIPIKMTSPDGSRSDTFVIKADNEGNMTAYFGTTGDILSTTDGNYLNALDRHADEGSTFDFDMESFQKYMGFDQSDLLKKWESR